jgi:hypothetical protein
MSSMAKWLWIPVVARLILGHGMIGWEPIWSVAEWSRHPGGRLAKGSDRLGLAGQWSGGLGAGLVDSGTAAGAGCDAGVGGLGAGES